MPRLKNVDLEHPVIELAEKLRWKVIYIERYVAPSGTIRRFLIKKAGLPTIKVMFCDDKLIGGSQWYYGQRMNKNTICTEATVKKWIRQASQEWMKGAKR